MDDNNQELIQAVTEAIINSDSSIQTAVEDNREAIIEALAISDDGIRAVTEAITDSDSSIQAVIEDNREAITEILDISDDDVQTIIEAIAGSDSSIQTLIEDNSEAITEALDISDDDIQTLTEAITDSDINIQTLIEDNSEAIAEALSYLDTGVRAITEAITDSDNDGNLDITPDDLNDSEFSETIDLTNSGDRQIKFTVNRETVFDNTVGFYEVSSEDGSVVDPLSGETIALGEEGYQEAALANRLDFSLGTANGETTEFTTELAGGSRYASFIVVDSEIGPLLDEDSSNDPKIYFGSATANTDGLDHVSRLSENSFGYEDSSDTRDLDFNDLVIEYDFV